MLVDNYSTLQKSNPLNLLLTFYYNYSTGTNFNVTYLHFMIFM